MKHSRSMRRNVWRLALLAFCVGSTAAFTACSDQPKDVSGDAGVDVKNKDLQANQRIKALDSAWESAKNDPSRLPAARQASKDVLWKTSAPEVLRQRALQLLLTDASTE